MDTTPSPPRLAVSMESQPGSSVDAALQKTPPSFAERMASLSQQQADSAIKSAKHLDRRLGGVAALDHSLKGSPGIKELGLVSMHRQRRSSVSGLGGKSPRSSSQSPKKSENRKRMSYVSPQKAELASPVRPASRHIRMESYVTNDSTTTDVSEADKHITLTVLDEQAELLEKMARQERRCLELKKMYAKEEAELERLRQQWESLFNQHTPEEANASSNRRFGVVDTPPNALNLSRSLHDKGTPQNKNAFFASPSKMASFVSAETGDQDYAQVQAQAFKAFELTKQKMSGLGKIIGGIFDGFILPEAVEIEERNRQVRAGMAQASKTPQSGQKMSMQNLRESNRHSNSLKRETLGSPGYRKSPERSKENLTPLAISPKDASSYFNNQDAIPGEPATWTWRGATLKMFENIDNAFGTSKTEPQTTPKQHNPNSSKRQTEKRALLKQNELEMDFPSIK